MSLVGVFVSEENPGHPVLWMVSDSRITDSNRQLMLEEGMKLFSLPIVCVGPDAAGLYSEPYFAQEIGLGCVGGTLIYLHVYATLVTLLMNLAGSGAVPSLEQIADTVARVTTIYVKSYGEKANSTAHRVAFVLGGYCAVDERLEAFEIAVTFSEGAFDRFDATPVDLSEGKVTWFGDFAVEAAAAVEETRSHSPEPLAWHRAPVFVLREFIQDAKYDTIGGDVQVGHTLGHTFTRGMTVSPLVHGKPQAVMKLNNIDLAELNPVGPCAIVIQGMTA